MGMSLAGRATSRHVWRGAYLGVEEWLITRRIGGNRQVQATYLGRRGLGKLAESPCNVKKEFILDSTKRHIDDRYNNQVATRGILQMANISSQSTC
jgi:hypothetical protein